MHKRYLAFKRIQLHWQSDVFRIQVRLQVSVVTSVRMMNQAYRAVAGALPPPEPLVLSMGIASMGATPTTLLRIPSTAPLRPPKPTILARAKSLAGKLRRRNASRSTGGVAIGVTAAAKYVEISRPRRPRHLPQSALSPRNTGPVPVGCQKKVLQL